MNNSFVKKLFFTIVLFSAIHVPETAAAAVYLDPATFEEFVSIGQNNNVEGSHLVYIRGINDMAAENLSVFGSSEAGYGGGTADALAVAGYPPAAYGEVSIDHGDTLYNGGVTGTSFTKIRYDFAVVQLDESAPINSVPVTISARGWVSVSELNSLNTSASASVYLYVNNTTWRASVNNVDENAVSSFNEEVTVRILPGFAYSVYMETLIQLSLYYPDSFARADAFVDPVIEFAEGFEDADKYSLVLSPGINTVPLPSSLVLLSSALITIYLRRKK